MANNVAVTPGSGLTFKTTDNSGVHTTHHNIDNHPPVTNAGVFVTQENGAALTALQLIDDAIVALAAAIAGAKGMLAAGTDGTNARALAVTAAGLLKVDDGGGSLSIDDNAGTLTVDDGGSSLSVDDNGGSLTVDGNVGITGSVAVTGPVTDTQIRATPLPVSGTVGVSGTVPVSGPQTDAQARATPLAVSGPVTDAQLRATPVPVAGTVAVSGLSGSVAVTGPLTDAQLRATPVPTADGGALLTAAQLIDDFIVSQAAAAAGFKIGLVGGTDGTNARALKTTTGGLLQIDSVPAGSALIGRTDLSVGGTAVSSTNRVPTANPSVITLLSTVGTQTSGAYTAGFMVDGKLTLANAVPVAAGGGIIHMVKVFSKSPQTGAFWVVLFNADPSGTTFTNNAAVSIADADLSKIIGVARCDQVFNLGAGSIHQASALGFPFKLPSGTTMYACIITVAAITTTSTIDIQAIVDVLPDG